MGADALVKAVGKERAKLDAQQTPLGQQCAVLLDEGEEMGQSLRAGSHHRLTKEGADLGTTDVEDIAQAGYVLQCDIRSLGRQSVAQTGAVHI